MIQDLKVPGRKAKCKCIYFILGGWLLGLGGGCSSGMIGTTGLANMDHEWLCVSGESGLRVIICRPLPLTPPCTYKTKTCNLHHPASLRDPQIYLNLSPLSALNKNHFTPEPRVGARAHFLFRQKALFSDLICLFWCSLRAIVCEDYDF